jgi:Fe-S oxidoreductase
LKADAAREVLRRMGLSFEEPEQGCCGMAGSFGFEKGKYDISMQIAEANLLPAVRRAETDTYIVADGFSCRTQMMQGSSRKVIHLAELLRIAFGKAEARQ